MRYSFNATVNHPGNVETDVRGNSGLSDLELFARIARLIRENGFATSFVVTIVPEKEK